MLRAAAILLALACSGSAAAQMTACAAGQDARQVAELLFGRKIGDRLGVSETQWGRFVDREISPRFPDGLTVLDARGAWRDSTARPSSMSRARWSRSSCPANPMISSS